jgi:hypothetical protein
MSASAHRALDAVAFQLVATVERYESHVDQLITSWLDMDAYRTVSSEIDEIQLYSSSLPQLAVQAVALLIAHSELVFALWRAWGTRPDGHEVQECMRRHQACVWDLHRSCLKFLRGGTGSGRLRPA